MAQVSLIMNVLAASIQVANRAGFIVRDVMSKGELGIVEKVIAYRYSLMTLPQRIFYQPKTNCPTFQSKNDLQTEADRSAQRCIIASLSKQFPQVNIIGEEGESDLNDIPADWLVTDQDAKFLENPCPDKYLNLTDDQSSSIVVWVDPLDGTNEYTQGFLEHVTVLIGLSLNEEAIGGKLFF